MTTTLAASLFAIVSSRPVEIIIYFVPAFKVKFRKVRSTRTDLLKSLNDDRDLAVFISVDLHEGRKPDRLFSRMKPSRSITNIRYFNKSLNCSRCFFSNSNRRLDQYTLRL